jgi:hypothetical protein
MRLETGQVARAPLKIRGRTTSGVVGVTPARRSDGRPPAFLRFHTSATMSVDLLKE